MKLLSLCNELRKNSQSVSTDVVPSPKNQIECGKAIVSRFRSFDGFCGSSLRKFCCSASGPAKSGKLLPRISWYRSDVFHSRFRISAPDKHFERTKLSPRVA